MNLLVKTMDNTKEKFISKLTKKQIKANFMEYSSSQLLLNQRLLKPRKQGRGPSQAIKHPSSQYLNLLKVKPSYQTNSLNSKITKCKD